MLLTACDDMHSNLYDVHSGGLIDSFSGELGGWLSGNLAGLDLSSLEADRMQVGQLVRPLPPQAGVFT